VIIDANNIKILRKDYKVKVLNVMTGFYVIKKCKRKEI